MQAHHNILTYPAGQFLIEIFQIILKTSTRSTIFPDYSSANFRIVHV